MNKLTKGAIAGGAGIVLLLGGAGTFALWNDSASVDGGTISTGTLTISGVGTAQWRDVSSDVTPSDVDDSFVMVPGDTLTLSQDFTIEADGDNLFAEVDYDYTAPAGLPTGVTATLAVTNGATAVTAGTPVSVVDGDTIHVVLTLDFASSTSGTTSQDASVTLDDVDLTVTQVRP
jgi:alternate signal-mediated exported protein